MTPAISVLVATIGRPGLEATLQSIVSQFDPAQDEVMVIGQSYRIQKAAEAFGCRYVECRPGRDWGHSERNFASPLARGRYLAHIDDDDVYAPGARDAMIRAIETTQNRPIMFKMYFPTRGITIWSAPLMHFGNVGTPMFLIPNEPEKFGTWGSYVGGDFGFLQTMKWAPEEIVWREEVIALIRPNS